MAAASRQIPLTCSGHTRPVVDLSFSKILPKGYLFISSCKDGKPMLRQGETGDWIGTFEGHKGAVYNAKLDGDAKRAATGAADFTVKLWNAESGEVLTTFNHNHIVKAVDFSKESVRLLSGSNEMKMRIFDLSNYDAEPDVLTGLKDNPKACLWAADDQMIISGGDDKCIRLWDSRTLSAVKQTDIGSNVMSVELSADGTVLTVTYGTTVAFYNPETLDLIKSYEVDTFVHSASLHPAKSCFVAGGDNFMLYKFDYESGSELGSYKGHFGPVHCVRFSPDGELYASGSEDGTIRLWQTTIGKTYGLWKALDNDERPCVNNVSDSPVAVSS